MDHVHHKDFYFQAVENRTSVYLCRNGWSGFFFVTGLEMSTGSAELRVWSFEAFVTIYLSITRNI
jgi:hypothetical protein